jgi:hypothetical protein
MPYRWPTAQRSGEPGSSVTADTLRRWQRAPGKPWRVVRQGVVVATGDGTLVLRGAAAEALVCLPASLDELRGELGGPDGDVDAETVGEVLEQLAAHDLTVEV